jgi:hypothetical protein
MASGENSGNGAAAPEHAVILEFVDFAGRFWTDDASDLDPLYELEDSLTDAITAAGAGDLDGHEIAMDGSHGFIYMYGPDARSLFAAVEPILRASPVAKGGKVTLRFGRPQEAGARIETVSL